LQVYTKLKSIHEKDVEVGSRHENEMEICSRHEKEIEMGSRHKKEMEIGSRHEKEIEIGSRNGKKMTAICTASLFLNGDGNLGGVRCAAGQRAALRFVGSEPPTAMLYLYSEMNLNEGRQRRSKRSEPDNSLGNRLAGGRQVFDVLVEGDEPARLDDSNLPAPFETRTGGLHSRVGMILPLPISTHKKNVTTDDHGTVVDVTLLHFL
jgi:hypothetical protein